MFEKALAESVDLGRASGGIKDKGELDFSGISAGEKLDVPEQAGGRRLAVEGEMMRFDFFFNEGGALVDGRVMDLALGNRDNFVGVFAEEADLGAGADGEFGFKAGREEAVCNEARLEAAPEKGEDLLPNRRVEEVLAKGAAGTGRKVGSGVCGKLFHNSSITCSQLV